MKKYLAVLGRQAEISLAELESLFAEVRPIGASLAEFESAEMPEIRRLGGILKIAEPIMGTAAEWLQGLPADGKLTLGVSDYSRGSTARGAGREALRLKHILTRRGRSVRIVPNKEAVLSSATTLHNRLWSDKRVELIKSGRRWYRVIAVQDIEAYVRRDQARPARDAKVGMLPPKLAQVLVNLCGALPAGTRVLDPFCGTGVVLQEAALMGYAVQGTDLSERMIEYTKRNLAWLAGQHERLAPIIKGSVVEQGDATNHHWQQPIDAVACEVYLGPPMSQPPAEIKLKAAKQECGRIILGALSNLGAQISAETPVIMAVPAWLRPDGSYSRLNLLDEIEELGYNVKRFKNTRQATLLYHRDGQVVAREIIVLRKK